ncbi:hypothetical protein BpHYR1_049773 [Brachionus plicatilis]|uniref:Uncharacterized protein n=1 Tax=Brachionus plicatilis TaxID=10195 RepID=A0A3M7Q058_BRAPC|nr:hypothetical protein BpHYR1_049773 [Brachionus plicatilis]
MYYSILKGIDCQFENNSFLIIQNKNLNCPSFRSIICFSDVISITEKNEGKKGLIKPSGLLGYR